MAYYSLKKILELNADYNVIIGERSNGKTTAVLMHGLEEFKKTGKQMAVIRRWDEDFKGRRGATLFDGIKAIGFLKKLFGDRADTVVFYRNMWYLAKIEAGKAVKEIEPFAFAFSLSTMEHDKSTANPNITTVLFDEFITRDHYLPEEFKLFQNTLSTIIRQRDDVKIFMCANTVDRYCIYFEEMGLNHVHEQRQGTIDTYSYGEGEKTLKVAVEYCSETKGKASDVYFAFDNPALKMITGGTWEIDAYPHLPIKYKPKDIVAMFFIVFNHRIVQGEFINVEDETFIYFHWKTTPLKETEEDVIYAPEYDYRYMRKRNIIRATDNLTKLINLYFRNDRVFYQTNEVGEVIRRYRMWCEEN